MSTRFYDTDLTDAACAFVAPVLETGRFWGIWRLRLMRAVTVSLAGLSIDSPRGSFLMNADPRNLLLSRIWRAPKSRGSGDPSSLERWLKQPL